MTGMMPGATMLPYPRLIIFQRLPSGKSLNPSGAGVGLAIVARIVETHGGAIRLEPADASFTPSWHHTIVSERIKEEGSNVA